MHGGRILHGWCMFDRLIGLVQVNSVRSQLGLSTYTSIQLLVKAYSASRPSQLGPKSTRSEVNSVRSQLGPNGETNANVQNARCRRLKNQRRQSTLLLSLILFLVMRTMVEGISFLNYTTS